MGSGGARGIVAAAAFALIAALGAARQESPAPSPALLQPVETDATRAMAGDVMAQRDKAEQLRKDGKVAEARVLLRSTLARALATPGRKTSKLLNHAIDKLAQEAIFEHDEETVILALEPCLVFRIAAQGYDNLEAQAVRNNLANSYWQSGEFERSYQLLREELEVFARTHEPDDPLVIDAKSNYAVVLFKRGDFEGSYKMLSEAVASLLKTHAPNDPDIQWAFSNLANTLDALGDTTGALAYREQVHATLTAVLPADSADLIPARENLAIALRKNGDEAAARLLLQSVLELEARHFPAGHRSIESTCMNLGLVLGGLGDFHSARILLEGVVERLEAREADDHPDLSRARSNLASTLMRMGEHQRALELDQRVYEHHRDTLGPDHALTLSALGSLSADHEALEHLDTAFELGQQVVEGFRQLGDDEESLLRADGNLCRLLARLGRSREAIEIARSTLARWQELVGEQHPKVLFSKLLLAGLIEDDHREASLVLLRDVAVVITAQLEAASEALSPREAELYVADYADHIAPLLARCTDDADTPMCFELVEAARAAPLTSARALRAHDRAAAADAEVAKLRDELRRKSAHVATLAYEGSRAEYRAATLERGTLERKLERAESRYGRPPHAVLRPTELAKFLAPDAVAVSYRRFEPPSHSNVDITPLPACFIAFVLHPNGSVSRVELGSACDIEGRIDAWRRALGVGAGAVANADAARAAGEGLRELVLDPVIARAGGAKRLVLALDDVLHLAPWDALPRGDGVVGDTLAIEVRASLSELAPAPARAGRARDLVAFGGIDFDALPSAAKLADSSEETPPEPPTLRSPSGRMAPVRTRFTPLDASNAEAREIAALFGSHAREEAHASVFDGARASKAALIANAGRARYLHVATHGFFAPEDVAVLGDDAGPTSFSEEVSGLSPRVLCGLAFAGANLPQDLVDRARGTLTAEELAYLDLDGCELAVLSACDTSAGLRRAGTGIASLQSALHAAGARTTLTSLWPVPDQATRELMLAFYRGLWSDGLPAAQALWRAKKTLRDRRAPARDWAGWVLTGG